MQVRVSNKLRVEVFLKKEGGVSFSARVAAGLNRTLEQQDSRQCH
jgi:hypothetical protein